MNRIPFVLAICAVLAQIWYPLVAGGARDVVTVAVVGLLAAASIVHAGLHRGARWTVVLVLTTAGLGLVAEIIGTATGYPFGEYFYAVGRLGPSIADVPIVVPLAWTAGFYPIWCSVGYVLRAARTPPEHAAVHRVIVVAIGMVGWDLYLDPQMVTDGQWVWTSGGAGLPGVQSIPVTNYLGWFAVASIMALIVEAAGRRTEERIPHDGVPIALFMWTWLGSALAHAVLLDGPELRFSAVYGFVAMGVVGVPVVWTAARSSRVATRHVAPGSPAD